ncbi:MAG: zinc-ribbon and FHA domain-containing protein [Myxococcales bacterium]|nr:zinc-ribbon and FHA domain-containing protein [Myxococcales bacterium]
MAARPCQNCGNDVPDNFKFCGYCGAPQRDPEPAPKDESKAPVAKLVVVKGEGIEGDTFPIPAEGIIAGRSEGDVKFPDDPHISPKHARFCVEGDAVTVEDLGGVNGIFQRVSRPIEIADGSFIICGEQVLQFRVPKTDMKLIGEGGTYFYGSPMPQVYFQIIQLLPGGREGAIYAARKRVVTIGREDCDLNFPSDRFMSRYHTKFEVQKGKFLLYDLESRNGTFLRVRDKETFRAGEQFFLGRQLMRIELT